MVLRDTATFSRLLRFALVGLVVTASYALVAWLAVRMAGMAPVTASMLAWAAVMLISYLGQKHFTFRSDGAHRVELPRFVVTAALAFIVSTAGMAGVVRAGMPFEFGIALAAVVIPLCSFVAMSLWVFAHPRDRGFRDARPQAPPADAGGAGDCRRSRRRSSGSSK